MTIGDRVLDWLLRRLERPKPIDTDLVLVRAHASLNDAPPSFSHREESWHFARVTGELTLRHALLRGGRLVAAVPDGFRVPPDLVDRAYLRRPITVEAQDIVAGLARNFCVRIQDAELADAILRDPERLIAHSAAWTFTGQVVTEAEVKQVLVAAELGFDRKLERLAPADLLAKWIVGGPPSPESPKLVEKLLREAHGRLGIWLAWALRDNQLDALVTAGAMAGSQAGRSDAPRPPEIEDDDAWEALRTLVEQAVRKAWVESPTETRMRLGRAETLVSQIGLAASDAMQHPLLRRALEMALFEYAHKAATGTPPRETELAPLGRNLHAAAMTSAIGLVEELARLARFCDELPALEPKETASAPEWAIFARDHTAWADLSARVARRHAEQAPPDLAAPRRRVMDRYLQERDRLNRRFADRLAKTEADSYKMVALRQPLPLHLVTRVLVRPLVDAGHRVFLVVLDGCDLSTLYEILREHPDDLSIGLCLPASDGALRSELDAAGPLHVGLSPIPTVTSHARRALFGGELPKNPALDETESEVANARDDHVAWSRNTALADLPRKLLLKGELGHDGENVVEALEAGTEKVVAVVFNGVDDALSSHQTTAIRPWNYGNVGGGFKRALQAALRKQWTILVTSDHGHTPFWTAERKQGARGAQRYATTQLPRSVTFGAPDLRTAPLHLLTAVGDYVGTQVQGFHGGAGLEEVVVPIAMLGPVGAGDPGLMCPEWWTGEPQLPTYAIPSAEPGARPQPPRPAPEAPTPLVASGTVGLAVTEALQDQPKSLRVLEIIATKGVITAAQIGLLIGKNPTLTRGLVVSILTTIQRKRVEPPFTTEEQGQELVCRWKIRS